MEHVDWSEKVKEALRRTDIMALSTIGSDGSWTSPVQYSHDKDLNLYFQSHMDTKHVGNLLKDPRVSVAIYYPERFPEPNSGSLGLQIKGKAELIDKGSESVEMWHRFKITPEEVWCFDSRVERKRMRIDLSSLEL